VKRLRPFFPYYGSKHRLASSYPAPRFASLIEPFAGAAGYATRHYGRRVHLYDANPIVVGVWEYLIGVRGRELRALPAAVEHVQDLRGVPQEARWLVGFWLSRAQVHPANKPTPWARSKEWPSKFWGETVRDMLAEQIEHIRHWRVRCATFSAAPDVIATWFVDPPYSGTPGAHYRRYKLPAGAYAEISSWCRARRGQVIVCENAGAAWLPFRTFKDAAAMKGRSLEAIWTNDGSERPQLEFELDVE
jgi:hypothetical protein